MIRVLLVDDSPLALHILQRLLSRSPEIQVVGTAANGKEGLALLTLLNPDVICTDLHMPVMDGLAFTRQVMSSQPRPILVLSVSVEPHSQNVFTLLEAGAVDVYQKPRDILEADQDKLARDLASRIRIIAGVHVFRHPAYAANLAATAPQPMPPLSPRNPVRIIAIGASTGGPQALREILGRLPSDFPLPLICIQHIGADFLPELLAWLAGYCRLPLRTTTIGETPQAGTVYFASGETHLILDSNGNFSSSTEPPCEGHRPSITVTFRAVARRYGASAAAVLLTGMGRDGAEGMRAIADAGGITLAQDEASCVVYGMPKEAVALGAVRQVLPLEQIAPALITLADQRLNSGIGRQHE